MDSAEDFGAPLLASMMFVPGTAVFDSGAFYHPAVPAVILDLEDTVARGRVGEARDKVASVIARASGRCAIHVRVNRIGTMEAWLDLLAVVRPGLSGIVLPKVESAWEVRAVDWVVSSLEVERGLAAQSVQVTATIETVEGVTSVTRIARSSSRLRRLCFGSGDFSADLGLPASHIHGRRAAALELAMQQIALASAAAGLEPPHDGVYPFLTDSAGLAAEVARSFAMGFWGKHTLSVEQSTIVMAALADLLPNRTAAVRRVEEYQAAIDRGEGVAEVDGYFVNNTESRRAQATLQLWSSLASSTRLD